MSCWPAHKPFNPDKIMSKKELLANFQDYANRRQAIRRADSKTIAAIKENIDPETLAQLIGKDITDTL